MGPLEVGEDARRELVSHAGEGGALRWGTAQESESSTQRVSEMLQLIASLREYQYA